MQRRSFLRLCGGAAVGSLATAQQRRTTAGHPNVVVILADDIGYGDIGCYGAKVPRTPNVDRLAARSLRFTDAHSSAATCTPSRYSLITGEYAFRKKGTGILPGDANLVIDTQRLNLPALMRKAGYATGAVGKWHLGLGNGPIDWNGAIAPGPREVGFDYSFIIPATGDRTPCVFVENQRVANLDPKDPITVSYSTPLTREPTGREHPELLRMKLSGGHDQTIVNGISRIGYMSGGKSARWVDEDIAKTITGKAVSFIDQNRAKPFFLYFATHDIHVPRVPHAQFAGKSRCGVRCDVIEEFDWSVGQVLAALDRNRLSDNTLVIVTSDNGPVVDDGYADGAMENLNGHTPAGPLRGGKYSVYEGGTRMPFLAAWPRRIKPGVSDALVCQVDLMASFASLTDQQLPENAAPDSFNMLPALLGESKRGRDVLVEQAPALSLRQGNWKLVGRSPQAGKKAIEQERATAVQELYDLSNDIGEKKNLAQAEPERVKQMTSLLNQIRTNPRSRP